ncbi:hypothetical protein A3737_18535 [Oleiphilus sp. HI0065]|nr:hypothetical protein A3737_18535 [Oleiphilus sp. HI0065]
MNALANRLDNALEKLSHNKELKCAPRLNPKKAQSYWLNQPGAHKPKLEVEKNQGRTLTYEQSLRQYSN